MVQNPAVNVVSGSNSESPVIDIQLLVVDIDGTIAGESNEIRPAVIEAIHAVQAKGIPVAIATGRMYRSALRFYEAVGSKLPLMSYQGALIKDPTTGQLHRHWAISKPYALQLIDHFEQPEMRSELSIHLYINDQLYVREITPETELYAERSQVEAIAVGDLRQALDHEPTKILALSHNTDLVDHLLTSLRQRYTPAELYFTKSVATFFEATNPLVNKGTAVRYLAEEMLGLQPHNVMTIGDNFNDVEMLEYAGIGVAMGNAPTDVQAIAQWIAPSVEADGVAVAIEKFLL
ncbi:HAD family phosphatase [Oscillatoria sp. FACHB-1407]|uniref:Cof-type HAD-IIB family hydrolase n=1 Tax=Oscillatoria sp. FACHB-1407 TaxID=2692847 RepID=UPI001686162D|nr:Cof-type HAD-IIB family hydrolase [Oscillatoria sp. FACHB-1407]MBD2460974.1 HAD family phosphatase [Oscillatoria sp. FACHB-1407]